jgi:hypothetical protein
MYFAVADAVDVVCCVADAVGDVDGNDSGGSVV